MMRPWLKLFALAVLALCVSCNQPLQKKPEPPQPPPASDAPSDEGASQNFAPGLGTSSAGKMCGGIAAIPCGAGELCHYEPGACRMPDASGTCKRKPEVCTQDYRPVCGCDGKTYSNACMAEAAGTSVAATGPCAQQ